jgi:hypothetical protein
MRKAAGPMSIGSAAVICHFDGFIDAHPEISG